MKKIFLRLRRCTRNSTTSFKRAHPAGAANRTLAGEEKLQMNVHYLTRGNPARSASPAAFVTRTGTVLPDSGVWSVTDPNLHHDGVLGTDVPQFEESFPADPAAITPVRRRLRTLLRKDGLEHLADDVTLICQELMANAVLHGCLNLPPRTRLKITVAWSDTQLRAVVHDPSNELPKEQDDSRRRTGGRGLRLVGALSDRWGVETTPALGGKSVWTELDLPRPRVS
ncbi:ATP-binding protein [Streptomyces rubiginosohelvolus]|uniref:ATP-binding protein n=1 Tax=Streptomyces rubiginosohelvolus TaxID=67362 RepID=UPI0035DCCF33